MHLRLATRNDVRLFTAVMVIAMVCGSAALHLVMMPPEMAGRAMLSGGVVAALLTAPIAHVVGTRMRRAHDLNRRLRQAISYDPLTGAHTRTHFHARVAQLRRGPMTVIVADIDHFKAINDRFGHQAGDMALQQVARTLMNNCRASDVVARFGGEEFVILMPGSEAADGRRAAERLCRRMRAGKIMIEGTAVKMTASFGVSGLHDPARIKAAIREADRALYRAKAAGRDRVCIFAPASDGEEEGRRGPAPRAGVDVGQPS